MTSSSLRPFASARPWKLKPNTPHASQSLLDSVTRLNEELTPRRFGMRRRDVPAVAAEVLQRLSALSDSDLLSLDKRVRSWSEYLHWGHGANLPRGFVAGDLETVRAAASSAAFARSGFIREQACRCLAGFLPWSTALLLIRTSDWVPQVRAVALEALAPTEPNDLVAHLALVGHLTRDRSRADELRTLVEGRLRTDAGSLALSAARRSHPDVMARRTAWTLSLAWSPEAVRAELTEAARAPDPWLRWWASGQARAPEVEGGVRREVAAVLLEDRVGRLRAQGLQLVIDAGDAETGDLMTALSDRSASVRSVAQAYLKRAGTDTAERYRTRLTSSPRIGDIYGLGETGSEADADLIAPWLESSDARLRRAALIATVALLDQRAVRTAMDMLHDQSPRVAGTAMRLISRRRVPDDLVEALERQAVNSAFQDRRRAVVLLRPFAWRWLLAVLRNLPAADSDMAHFLDTELAEWLKRSARISIGPPSPQATEIRERLSAVDTASARVIEFVLRTSTEPG